MAANRRVRNFFLAPAIIYLLFMSIYPLIYSLYLSTTRKNLSRPYQKGFIGLENYSTLINNDLFRTAIENTIVLTIASIAIELIIAFFIARLFVAIADVPGSSAYFERGVVAYANQAKIDLLGVPAEILARHGAVSEETARAMAEGVRRMAKTDIGLSITGIAGPSGGTKEKPVGTVFIAVADSRQTICRHHSFRWDRRRNKLISSEAALVMLKNFLEDENK